jgi:hypothetical protein
MGNAGCAEHDRLMRNALEQLKKLNELTKQQFEILEAGYYEQFMKIDREVELALGEKERRIGSLRQYDEEHGCQSM